MCSINQELQNEEQIFQTTLTMWNKMGHKLTITAAWLCVLTRNRPSPTIDAKGALGLGEGVSGKISLATYYHQITNCAYASNYKIMYVPHHSSF